MLITNLLTVNAIIVALILSFFVLTSVVWHISDIKRLYATTPKIANLLILIPITLGVIGIFVLWIGVVKQWPVWHGVLMIVTLIAIGLYARKVVLR